MSDVLATTPERSEHNQEVGKNSDAKTWRWGIHPCWEKVMLMAGSPSTFLHFILAPAIDLSRPVATAPAAVGNSIARRHLFPTRSRAVTT
jgi:hypothetical protein